MKVIHVARKPLSGTVAANALQYGTGGLNIDAGRIGYPSETDKTPTVGTGEPGQRNPGCGPTLPSRKENWGEWRVNDAGRWPANIVLVHEPGCRRAGVKKVQPLEGHRPNPVGVQADGFMQLNQKPVGYQKTSYTGEDGLEEVEAWECVEGCPVKDLDDQSGFSISTGGQPVLGESNRHGIYGSFVRTETGTAIRRGDSGGASRFFKQVGGAS